MASGATAGDSLGQEIEDIMKSFYCSTTAKRNDIGLRVAVLALGGFAFSANGATAQLAASPAATWTVAQPMVAGVNLAENDSNPVASPLNESPASSSSFFEALPDAPSPQLHKLDTPPATPEQAQRVAPLYTTTIPAGYRAQPLTARNKVVLGLRDSYSLESLAAIALSAGYAHVTDGQPNYGVNSKAFAQRLGASAARETSQNIFTESIMAPLLHEDPRYYVKGPSYNPVKRTIYAITRPLVTRTDAGNRSVNGALLIGYAGAAALTPAYYPEGNRNFHDVASTFGGSIGGAAIGDFVSEFADDVLTALHLKRLP